MFTRALVSAAIVALSSTAKAQNEKTGGLSLTAQLRLADTAVDRYALLSEDDDFIFDFNESDTGFADSKSFPALVGAGGAMAFAEIPACGIVATHIHPRSAELFAVATGRVYTESIPEGGVLDPENNPRVIRAELGPLQMTVFHQGAFHTQMNPDCEPALAVASFSSEDPGAAAVAPQLFALSDDVLISQFGGTVEEGQLDKIREALSEAMLTMHDECRAKCGPSSGDAEEPGAESSSAAPAEPSAGSEGVSEE